MKRSPAHHSPTLRDMQRIRPALTAVVALLLTSLALADEPATRWSRNVTFPPFDDESLAAVPLDSAIYKEAAEGLNDLRLLDEPGARCPVAATARLWAIARRETGDPAFGLKVASLVTGNTFHALGYSIAPSSTLKAAFERMARYAHIFSDAAENRFVRAGDGYHYILKPHVELPHECIDAFVSLYVRMCRALSDDRTLSPLRIELRRGMADVVLPPL